MSKPRVSKTESSPREFWTSIHDNHLSHLPKDMDFPEDWIHVREVVEINDEEINAANKFLTWSTKEAFEAGARWAIAKLTRADNE